MKKIIYILLILTNISFSQNNVYKKIEKNTLQGTLYGILNTKTNKEVIQPKYKELGKLSNGKFVAIKEKLVGVIDTLDNEIIPFKYTYISDYLNDRTFLSLNGKLAMADENGKVLTQFIYDDILGYNDNVIRFSINKKIGFMDKHGKTIFPAKFDIADDCVGKFIVVYSKKWESFGYDIVTSNRNGKEVGRTNIGTMGKFPLIFTTDGKLVYRGENNEYINISKSKKVAYTIKNKPGYSESEYVIIKDNGEIKTYLFRDLTETTNWYKITSSDDKGWKYGIMNLEGEIILQPNFKNISNYDFNNNLLAKVEFRNGDFFFINKKGECVEFNEKKCPE